MKEVPVHEVIAETMRRHGEEGVSSETLLEVHKDLSEEKN